jgi:hypothetical protein
MYPAAIRGLASQSIDSPSVHETAKRIADFRVPKRYVLSSGFDGPMGSYVVIASLLGDSPDWLMLEGLPNKDPRKAFDFAVMRVRCDTLVGPRRRTVTIASGRFEIQRYDCTDRNSNARLESVVVRGRQAYTVLFAGGRVTDWRDAPVMEVLQTLRS